MTEEKIRKGKANREKLTEFGFIESDGAYFYRTELFDGKMLLCVKIDADGKIYSELVDEGGGEEYILHRVAGASGAFVGRIKSEYGAVLERIVSECFDPEVFRQEQTKAVISYMRSAYGEEPEYLWERFPDNAAVRRKDNAKWYAAILTVSRRKLGFDSDGTVEVIDLRMTPDEIEKRTDGKNILPGYHMNKKHWITICLDGTCPMPEIFRLIDDSRALAHKK